MHFTNIHIYIITPSSYWTCSKKVSDKCACSEIAIYSDPFVAYWLTMTYVDGDCIVPVP